MPAWWVVGALGAGAAAPSRAHGPVMGGAGRLFDFHAQAQIGLHGALALPRTLFGLTELRGAASISSLGIAASLGYERALEERAGLVSELHAGYFGLAIEFRPTALADDDEIYRWFDPFVGVGGRIGFTHDGAGADVRAALTIDLGFDVRMGPRDPHAALTVRYRMEPARHPVGVDWHMLVFGISVRTTDD